MSVLAAIRPDDWNIALFVHVAGAMALFGSLVLVATALAGSDLRLGYRALLIGAIPSWIVMRVGAQWIASKEHVDDIDPAPAWVGIGYGTSEGSFLLLIIATVCAGVAARRVRGGGLRTTTLVLVGISLVAYVVAIWAMATKPS
ncbi:MAG TPA: hypothetical protein VK307_09740 [Thermoleophilaceae bacterium]|nr:hypothetical protein [Thermoleophilaceae bacterium]